MVEEGLGFEGFEGDDFEAAGAADAEFGAEEVDRGGFGGDVEFLDESLAWASVAVVYSKCRTRQKRQEKQQAKHRAVPTR